MITQHTVDSQATFSVFALEAVSALCLRTLACTILTSEGQRRAGAVIVRLYHYLLQFSSFPVRSPGSMFCSGCGHRHSSVQHTLKHEKP